MSVSSKHTSQPSESETLPLEARLRQSEKLLELAIAQTGLWIWVYDWNNSTARFMGKVAAGFHLPKYVDNFPACLNEVDVIDPGSVEPLQNLLRAIANGQETESVDVRLNTPDGLSHWARLQLTNLTDDDGNLIGEAVGTTKLIDDIKNLEERYQIEKNRSRLEDSDLIAYASFNITKQTLMDADGGNEFSSAEKINTIEDLGAIVTPHIVGADKRLECEHLHRRSTLLDLYDQGNLEVSMEYQRRMKYGRIGWLRVDIHLMRDPQGSDILAFAYCHDIDRQKNMDVMISFAVDVDYDLLGCGNFHDGMATMTFGERAYNPFDDSVVSEDYTLSLFRFTQNSVVPEEREAYLAQAGIDAVRKALESSGNLEFTFHTKDPHNPEKTLTKKARYVLQRNDPNIFVWSQTDVTSLVAEEAVKQERLKDALTAANQGNQAKTDFLSNMSHEIRTPMNAIIGMTKLALDVPGNPGETEGYLEEIDSSSQYLLGILNDVLDMSRIESGRLELHPAWISAQEYFFTCVDMVGPSMKSKHINFIYPNPTDHNNIEVFVDPLRIRQIAMNLLNNAYKFTPEGGTVSVEFSDVERTDDLVIEKVVFRDTGCGMSEEFLSRIFNPFEQEHNPYSDIVQGTGLGLSLVKRIVEAMGGTVKVESTLGQGSAFIITIPCKYRIVSGTSIREREKLPVANLEGKHVLLVEDTLLNREIACTLLERRKVTVDIATDGVQAVKTFEDSDAGYYDAILMDIRMPNMNGLEATRAIRSMNHPDAADIPIIAMTANAFDEDRQQSLESGMNAHLSKPVDPDTLYETLAKCFTKH